MKLRIKFIKELLEEQGRTKRWLAKSCGLKCPSLSHILAGTRKPSLPVIKLMAIAFGVSESSILEVKEVENGETSKLLTGS